MSPKYPLPGSPYTLEDPYSYVHSRGRVGSSMAYATRQFGLDSRVHKLLRTSSNLSEIVVARRLHFMRQLLVFLVELRQEHCLSGSTCEEILLVQGRIGSDSHGMSTVQDSRAKVGLSDPAKNKKESSPTTTESHSPLLRTHASPRTISPSPVDLPDMSSMTPVSRSRGSPQSLIA